ncbi:MAG: phosphatidylserine decarboxylase [Gammaproteobacteria bacterium]|nr:phosphatidylserine decarboxylase [Gammaproteobacteria bacterium]NNJ48917.1 phosphatidylserine decarboxylase [Gammaproteobacteria bacterium]
MKQKLLALLFYILPHHAISWLMFKLARIRWAPLKNYIIRTYTRLNPVKMHEAVEEDMFAYESLNAFFTRALKPECRPFDGDEKNWLCPVDGSVSQAQQIKDGRIFQAKGQEYSLLELVGGDRDLEKTFKHGQFATLYLSPRDYHRIHMPATGVLKHMQYIPGRLFSVATFVVNHIPRLFARNERCVCYFETEQGPMALILVGAINVSAIETTWHGLITSETRRIKRFNYSDKDIVLKRGDEMGRFNLGSTVIVLATDRMKIAPEMTAEAEIKLGQCLATPAHTGE